MTKPLRFAPLVRVSTEGQEKKGESLRTQKAQIEQAVKVLGGVLIPDPWRYSGQEHATPEYEHRRIDQLLKDAEHGLFDAIIVCDPSRWSRDNLKSKQGIQILKHAGVRFFCRQIEYDLFDPTATFYIGMTTEVNEYMARLQTQKAMLNRIARALRNIPTSGNLPYGRTFDKATETWGVDNDKQKKIAVVAEKFLNGEKLDKLAKLVGIHPGTLWKVLTQRCGDSWEVRFRSNRLRIDEEVVMKVPSLLPRETIARINERVERNKGNKVYKYEYLLSRMVFCRKCGYPMFGQVNRAETRYYRHVKGKKRGCDMSLWCPAEELEEAVLVRLFATVGDAAGMEAAMSKVLPDKAKVAALREKTEFLEKELSKVQSSKDRLIQAVSDGLFSKEEVAKRIEEIRERENLFKAEIDGITSQLGTGPTEEEVRRRAKLLQRMIGDIYRSPSRLAKMTFQERRKLIETFFGGKDAQGRRLGIYLERDRENGTVRYEIRGAFDQTFQGTVLRNGLNIQDFKDASIEHVEDLKTSIRAGGGKSSKSLGVQDRPYHDKRNYRGKDHHRDPQVEQ